MAVASGRSETLRTPIGVRVLLTVVGGGFFVGTVVAWARQLGGGEWSGLDLVVYPVLAVLGIGSVLGGVVGSWTNRVWVDYDRMEVHQFVVLGDAVRTLDPPGTARLAFRPATANTVSSTWKVVFAQPGLTSMSVSTPWVANIQDVLRLLQPALERNPDLAADDHTREMIRHPEQLRPPP